MRSSSKTRVHDDAKILDLRLLGYQALVTRWVRRVVVFVYRSNGDSQCPIPIVQGLLRMTLYQLRIHGSGKNAYVIRVYRQVDVRDVENVARVNDEDEQKERRTLRS